ncbi:hypothetical protein HKX48_001194 [Thoreauomyces humboldtii]|nr:hypothetical protein HKX48_001194 [Thoreauomyces humboldtii]
MDEEGGRVPTEEPVNVASLAKESLRHDKKAGWVVIPLTVLAPLIIVLTLGEAGLPNPFSTVALEMRVAGGFDLIGNRKLTPPPLLCPFKVGSLVPAYWYLLTGTDSAVLLLSNDYLNSVMFSVSCPGKMSMAVGITIHLTALTLIVPRLLLRLGQVKLQILNTVNNMAPVTDYFVNNYDVQQTLLYGNPNGTLQNAAWVTSMVKMHRANNLNALSCNRVMWRDGYGFGDQFNRTSIRFVQVSTYDIGAANGFPIIFRYDFADNTIVNNTIGASIYGVNTTSYAVGSFYYKTDLFAPTISAFQAVNTTGAIIRRNTYFNVFVDKARNTSVAYVSKQYFLPGAALPSFYCTSGQRLDLVWYNILRDARPNNNSIVAIFKQDFSVAGSSYMTVTNATTASTSGVTVFVLPVPDALTVAFQTYITDKYSSNFYAGATEDPSRTETTVLGTDWIVLTQVLHMSGYADQDYFLMTAIPRVDVYGQIDATRKKALGVSLGIASGMAVLSVGLFIMVVIPLFKLARAMATLTKLDFGSLERSNQLDDRSFIWEVRKVQEVFGAGGLKRNKAMATANMGPAMTSSGGNSMPGRKASEVTQLLPPGGGGASTSSPAATRRMSRM